MKFIKTTDKNTIDELKKSGFILLFERNGVATFLNDSKLVFNKTNKKIFYSDKIEM